MGSVVGCSWIWSLILGIRGVEMAKMDHHTMSDDMGMSLDHGRQRCESTKIWNLAPENNGTEYLDFDHNSCS